VRLVFRNAATVIELDLRRSMFRYVGVPARPDGVIDLMIDGVVVAHSSTSAGTAVTIDLATGVRSVDVGPICTARFTDLSARTKDVELWLPHNEIIELVQLRADALVEPGRDEARPVWLHHGSSISQGSNAARPTGVRAAVLRDVHRRPLAGGVRHRPPA
jgi:hypothetical protein